MNARLNVWFVGALAFLAAAPVCAGPGGGHGHRFAEPGGLPMFSRPSMERPMRPAEFRRDELPMSGRMSPEERRQLRRDIRSAGDDLYRRPPPPPSPEDR